MGENKRAYFRVVYPLSMNPVFKMEGRSFRVVDISEGGFSFWQSETAPVIVGEILQGAIVFGNRGEEVIRAEVLRIDEHRVSLQFLSCSVISFSRMMQEQRALIHLEKQLL